ncbi:MAG: tetratricopeptide repeat protein [Silvanigrellales bacterium]|nr:tetratricopeptide repeat protein [Silvanigrellales bacterium]
MKFRHARKFLSLTPLVALALDPEAHAQARRAPERAGAARSSTAGRTATTASSDAPPALGGSSRGKLTSSGARINVKDRNDNVVEKKKQGKSKREIAEGKGNRVRRGEIEAVALERALGGAIGKESTYMEKLLPKLGKKSPQRPEILRRLVENYHQQAILTFFKESRAYDVAWQKWDNGGRRGTEPMFTQRQSKVWTSKVIQRAQQYITEYPKGKAIDEAYFQVAYALDQMGDSQSAASYYSQLVAKFPNSKRLPDAHYALGEFYFGKQDFKKALTAFSQVTRFTRAPIYPWAVYKIAWCYYNLRDYANSRGSFQRVVSLAGQGGAELTPGGKIKLKEEALRDLVLVFAELQDIDGAERYYASVGGEKYYGEMLMRLADLLRESGEYDKSVVVLKRFLARNPYNIKAAEIQVQIVDTSNLKVDKKLLWQEMAYLLKNYTEGTPWAQRNANEREFKESLDQVHTVAITYPKKQHAMAQKDNNKYLFAQAEIGYGLYLRSYPKRTESLEVRFHLAEIQYQQNRYRESAKNFWAITEFGNDPKKNPYFQKSATYLLSASFLEVEKEMKALRAKPAKLKQAALPMSADFTEYVRVCDSFIKWFPKDKAVLDCRIDTAEIYLKHNRYDEAEKRLTQIAADSSERKEGQTAAEILLWMNADDTRKLMAVADTLWKIPAYQKGDIGKRIREIKQANRFVEIANVEKSGNNKKAAEEFERLAREGGSEADKAWYNAGVNYRKAGDTNKSTEAFSMVYTKYPKSPQSADAMAAVIEMSEARLQLDKAASVSTQFLARYPQDKRSGVIQRETCFLYDALNNLQQAQKTCSDAIKMGGQGAADAAKALADMYERNNRYADFVRIVDTNVMQVVRNPTDQIIYLGRAADAERKSGRASAAAAREAKIVGIYSSNRGAVQGQALSVVAEIEYQKHAPVLQKFRNTRLEARKPDGSDLQASIVAKQGLLQQVEQSYKKVVAIGDAEWGVASLYTIGYAYEVFGKDLQNPPVPPGTPPEAAAKLKGQLSGLGKPIELKSGEYYKESAGAVSKFGVYTEFSQKTSAALSRIYPAENRKLDEWVPEAVFVGTQLVETGKVKPVIQALGGQE